MKNRIYCVVFLLLPFMPVEADRKKIDKGLEWVNRSEAPKLGMHEAWLLGEKHASKIYNGQYIQLDSASLMRTKFFFKEWHYVIKCSVFPMGGSSGPSKKITLHVDFGSNVFLKKEWISHLQKRRGVGSAKAP